MARFSSMWANFFIFASLLFWEGQCAPKFEIKQQKVTIKENSLLTLDCTPENGVVETYKWTYPNYFQNGDTNTLYEPTLTKTVTMDDTGIYRCTAADSDGSDTKVFDVTVTKVDELRIQTGVGTDRVRFTATMGDTKLLIKSINITGEKTTRVLADLMDPEGVTVTGLVIGGYYVAQIEVQDTDGNMVMQDVEVLLHPPRPFSWFRKLNRANGVIAWDPRLPLFSPNKFLRTEINYFEPENANLTSAYMDVVPDCIYKVELGGCYTRTYEFNLRPIFVKTILNPSGYIFIKIRTHTLGGASDWSTLAAQITDFDS